MKHQHSSQYFGKTASGNLNQNQANFNHKLKQIDLDSFDQYYQQQQNIKTLKKPIKELVSSLVKTNPKGIGNILKDTYSQFNHHQQTKNTSNKYTSQPKHQPRKNNWIQSQYTLIQSLNKQIKPAYKRSTSSDINFNFQKEFLENDKNSIISALMNKGNTVFDLQPNINIIKAKQNNQTNSNQKSGPAQKKLKSLFKKEVKFIQQPNIKPVTNNYVKQDKKKDNKKVNNDDDQIAEEIIESIEQYGNQSFEKLSGVYQSAIKESIKESLGGSSGIKQSIRQQIKESIIGQSINQYKSSKGKQQIKESIRQSIQQSDKKDSYQQIYQDVFEEESIQESLAKSRSRMKKKNDKLDLSESQSKGFRTKTASVIKSQKIFQELRSSISGVSGSIQQRAKQRLKGDKVMQDIDKQKALITNLKTNISNFLKKKPAQIQNVSKNKTLLYNFKIELNKLLTSQNFQSKLRKLTSFLNIDPYKPVALDKLQNDILANIMGQINKIKAPEPNSLDIENLKKDYDEKLQRMLKAQQINLRAQMNDKLAQKDMQLKKMIAQLEQKMLNRTAVISQKRLASIDFERKSNYFKDLQVESDFSIDSDDIQWKADLWSVLPDYQKKKLFEKQANEVTKFLTDIMMNEIKGQALDRSLQISFEFPPDLEASAQSFPFFKRKSSEQTQQQMPLQSAFSRKQLQSQFDLKQKKVDIPDLPPIKRKVEKPDNASWLQDIPKIETQGTKKDNILKTNIVKTLSTYKAGIVKKKNDAIRKVLKTLQLKGNKNMASALKQITILNEKQIRQKDLPYVRAYEQNIINELFNIYNRCGNRKGSYIEQQMKKMYERLAVTCQVQTAEDCSEMICLVDQPTKFFNVGQKIRAFQNKSCPIQIPMNENYIQYKQKQNEKDIKNNIVNSIIQMLAQQFAKQFPKKKK